MLAIETSKTNRRVTGHDPVHLAVNPITIGEYVILGACCMLGICLGVNVHSTDLDLHIILDYSEDTVKGHYPFMHWRR
jgi:hypothetical protein